MLFYVKHFQYHDKRYFHLDCMNLFDKESFVKEQYDWLVYVTISMVTETRN